MSQQTNNTISVSPKIKRFLGNTKISFREKIAKRVVRNKKRKKSTGSDTPKDGASAPCPRFQIDTQVFGVSLEDAIARSVIQDEIPLPTVFRECLDFIESIGMESEGIYRVGGVKTHIEIVKKQYDRGEFVHQ